MRSSRTWKGESHVPKLLGILRARQQRGRRSAGQFWAGAWALARSQACAVSLGTRLSLHWVFSRPLSGLGELVLGSPVGMGECTRARSLWGSNSGSRTCSYITHLSKAGSSTGNGSNNAWAVEGPGEGRMRHELGRAPPTPSPEDAQVGRCHNVFLALEPLPGLQALWLQWSHVPLEGPLRAWPQHLCQRVKRPQNGQNPRSHWFYWTTQNELYRQHTVMLTLHKIKESKLSEACGNDTVHHFPTTIACDASFPIHCLRTTGYRPHFIDLKRLFFNKI